LQVVEEVQVGVQIEVHHHKHIIQEQVVQVEVVLVEQMQIVHQEVRAQLILEEVVVVALKDLEVKLEEQVDQV
jgi:hypothetical protein